MPSVIQKRTTGASASADEELHVASGATEEKFSEKMTEISLGEKERATVAEAGARGMPYIDLTSFPIAPEVLSVVPEKQATAMQTIPFFRSENEVRVATVNPDNPDLLTLVQDLTEQLHANIQVYLISQHSFERALALYKNIPHPKKYIAGVEIPEDEFVRIRKEISSFRDIQERVKDISMTQMLTLLLAGGIESRSTDIHIEAEEEKVKVRYRVDGVLQDVAEIEKKDWSKLISRIKLIARLKINIIDVPQDGRFTIYLTKERVEVRVSTLPTAFGESVVMRLLLSSSATLQLDDLGLSGSAYETLVQQFHKPHGMIMTTGPTGCGKTTTLYAIIKQLNTPDKKIITLEDPIEYKIPGINQSQVRESQSGGEGGGGKDLKQLLRGNDLHSYTFARGLRSILRQDPDIIMVGEIRDEETAEISIQAALTGHMVLSTIHTNTAAGTVPRFIAMDVKPFLLAPALNAIVAQRLVRKICTACKVEYTPNEREAKQAQEALEKIPEHARNLIPQNTTTYYKGGGCEECFGLGYKGRTGIYEVLTMNEEIEQMILAGKVSEILIEEIAVKHGMVTMLQDGVMKALQGHTTLEEVLKQVTGEV